MFARIGGFGLSGNLLNRHSPVGRRWTSDMVARVDAVRRSARLIAAVASENSGRPNPEKPVSQKVVGVVSGSKRSSRVSRTKSDGKIAVKEENEGPKESTATVVEVESVSQPNQVKPLRRTKSLKKFPSRDLETKLWEQGFRNVAGVDEAGRGPLAGPVVAAACIIPASVTIPGVDDSKKLTETQREELYAQIIGTPGVVYAIHVVDAAKIDEINILQATLLAMSACVNELKAGKGEAPDYVLVDGNRLPDDFSKEEAQFVIKGDAECHVIAAASILAKVTRDRMMIDYDKKWPEYGFKAHKGYGTAAHIGALLKHGPCDIHRRSFAPLKDRILQGNVPIL
ncbi:hypothetical protein KC19_2G166300 [Ceratodon purpureus]|uniref:Ribonuclease n=1 Tax=Ceratodon purpureus TaxID=3225 RepID=A0A8T0IW80_CERPU|nr:hypothetical protein KC19_2G166300 [Ceratodon purpureus]